MPHLLSGQPIDLNALALSLVAPFPNIGTGGFGSGSFASNGVIPSNVFTPARDRGGPSGLGNFIPRARGRDRTPVGQTGFGALTEDAGLASGGGLFSSGIAQPGDPNDLSSFGEILQTLGSLALGGIGSIGQIGSLFGGPTTQELNALQSELNTLGGPVSDTQLLGGLGINNVDGSILLNDNSFNLGGVTTDTGGRLVGTLGDLSDLGVNPQFFVESGGNTFGFTDSAIGALSPSQLFALSNFGGNGIDFTDGILDRANGVNREIPVVRPALGGSRIK